MTQYSHCIDDIEPEGSCTIELAEFSKNILKVQKAGFPECGLLQQNVLYAQFNGELQCKGMQSTEQSTKSSMEPFLRRLSLFYQDSFIWLTK